MHICNSLKSGKGFIMQQMKVSAVPCGQNWRNKHVKSNVESGVVMAFWLSTMLEVLLLAGCIFFVGV